jgi:hypothetical protein
MARGWVITTRLYLNDRKTPMLPMTNPHFSLYGAAEKSAPVERYSTNAVGAKGLFTGPYP